jgi:hypothetical protein
MQATTPQSLVEKIISNHGFGEEADQGSLA